MKQTANNNYEMTAKEVYEFLDISRTTLYLWTKKGILTTYKDPISKRIYYNRQEVEALNKANREDRYKQKTLKEIREAQGLSIQEVAKALKTSEKRYKYMEANSENMLEKMSTTELITFMRLTNTNANQIKGL